MLIDFIVSMIGTIVFYKIMDKTWRIDVINKYITESMSKGNYSEQYKNAYNHHLKGRCILITIVFFIIMILNIFTNSIISMIIGVILGLIKHPIIDKYYPNPKENL